MAKLTLEDLKKLREQKKLEIEKRTAENKTIEIIIGMATCGIAAGARDTFNTFVEEIEKNKMHNVLIRQTGCMGLCSVEPTVEIIMPEMPDIIYGNVDPATAKNIVEKHLIQKTLLNDHIFDKPAADNI